MRDALTGDGSGDVWPVKIPGSVLDGLSAAQRQALEYVWANANSAQRAALLMAPALQRAQYLGRVARIIAATRRALREAAARFANDTATAWELDTAPVSTPAAGATSVRPAVRHHARVPRSGARRRPPFA